MFDDGRVSGRIEREGGSAEDEDVLIGTAFDGCDVTDATVEVSAESGGADREMILGVEAGGLDGDGSGSELMGLVE